MQSMRKMMTLSVLSIAGIAFASTSFAGSNTGKGTTPNGKPFIEIAGQIVEVQNDISTLEADYQAIVSRIDAMELNLQGQIDAINVEIDALELKDIDLQDQITTLSGVVGLLGADVASLLTEQGLIQSEIDALEQATGDNTAAIAALVAELATVNDEIAANAADVVTLVAQSDQNADMIAMLLADVADLQNDKQNDIVGTCPTGAAVTTVNDDGSLVCGFANSLGEIVSYQVTSGYVDLDRYQTYYRHYHGFGYYHYHYYYTGGFASAYAYCPSGYTVAGGGYYLYDQNTGNVRVQQNYPYTYYNAWYIYFNNLAQYGTYNHYGYAYANCIRAQ